MTERTIQNPIDLGAIDEKRAKLAKEAEVVLNILATKFNPEANFGFMGEALFGSSVKVVTDENGKSKKVPLGFEDINDYLEKIQAEGEESERQAITKKANFATEVQSRHFTPQRRSARYVRAHQTIDFTNAVIERFQALPLPNQRYDWEKRNLTYARDEQVLQDFAKITLEGTRALWSNYNVDRAKAIEVLDQRHPLAWNAVVVRQEDLYKKYVDDIMEARLDTAKSNYSYVFRAVRNGVPEYSDEKVGSHATNVQKQEERSVEIKALHFGELLSYFGEKLGKPITFHDLLVPQKD